MSVVSALFLAFVAADAAPPSVAVAPLGGFRGVSCAQVIATALAPSSEVIPWPEDMRGTFSTFDELSTWLREGKLAADVVVLGHARSSSMIVGAYNKESGSLVGLLKLKVSGRGCKPSARSATRLAAWPGTWSTEVSSSPPSAAPLAAVEPAPEPAEPEPEEKPEPVSEPDLVPAPEPEAMPVVTETATNSVDAEDPKPPVTAEVKTPRVATRPAKRRGPVAPARPEGLITARAGIGLVDRSLVVKNEDTERELATGAFVAVDVDLQVAPFEDRRDLLAPLAFITSVRFAPGFDNADRGAARHLELGLLMGYAVDVVAWPVRLEANLGYRGYLMSAPKTGAPSVGYHGGELSLGLAADVTKRGELFGHAGLSFSKATEEVAEAGGLLGIRLQAGFRIHIVPGWAAVITGRYSTYGYSIEETDLTDKTGALTLSIEANFR